jgi:type I restriction enzyme S subunit
MKKSRSTKKTDVSESVLESEKVDSTPALVPKLRFPEFVGGKFRITSLGEVTAECTGRRGKKPISAAIMGVSKADGIVPMEERIIGKDTTRYKLLSPNCFAYNPMRINIGSIARWTGDCDVLVSPDYIVFRCIDDHETGISADYLDQFRGSLQWEKFVSGSGDGGVRIRIYYKDLALLLMGLPSLPEQRKIASCLASLDELIGEQGRKVDALRTHKKGLMQQLFPREGETQPQLRFPEFQDAGDWEEELFRTIYDFMPTNTYSRDKLNYVSGQTKNIHYGDIHTKFQTMFRICRELVPFVNSSESLGTVKADAYCQEGDMVFADASEDLNDVGKSIELVDLNGEMVLSGSHTILARQKGTIFVVGFAGYLFKGRGIRAQIEKESQGTKVLQISPRRLADIKIVFPRNHAEQQRIGSCLSSLDDLITAETQKLEALKTHKRGLMQQMFPSPEEAS